MQSAPANNKRNPHESGPDMTTPTASTAGTSVGACSPPVSTTHHMPGLNSFANAPSELRQSHVWPSPLEATSLMDHQTRALQNIVIRQKSELCQLRAEISRQGRIIDLMSEQLTRNTRQLDRTNANFVLLEEDMKAFGMQLSEERWLASDTMHKLSQIRSQVAGLRNPGSAYPSGDAQPQPPLARDNTSLNDWAASVMPRRSSYARTEDSRYWVEFPSGLKEPAMFW